jgi:hypothetical protein
VNLHGNPLRRRDYGREPVRDTFEAVKRIEKYAAK